MLNPSQLQPTRAGLASDRAQLESMISALTAAENSLVWGGGRADRFRSGLDARRRSLAELAQRMGAVADQIGRLQDDVQRELEYLAAIEHAVGNFLSSVLHAAQAAASAAAHELLALSKDAVTGNVQQFATDAASIFRHWIWHHGNMPPTGDSKWRDVDQYMRAKSGLSECHGITYHGPGGGGW